MPTSSKVQVSPPVFGRQMVACSGMRSPIFQPYLVAIWRPTTAPVRVRSHAAFCSGGSRNSGYMARYSSGLTGNWPKKFLGS